MTTKNIALLGLRLLAIYCFVQSVMLLSTYPFMAVLSNPEMTGRSKTVAYLFAFLPGGSLLLLAVLLFVFSEPIARRIAPPESGEPAERFCTFEQLQATAFAVAGILILATALPSVARAVQDLVLLYRMRGDNQAREIWDNWRFCIGVFAQLVAGLLLLLNPMGFRNAWHWLRTAGT
jgi:hypothetical protein